MTTSEPEPGGGFDERFEALAQVAYRVAYRLTGSRSDAEDITQEALARAFARWRRVRGHAEPWVARVAANLALDLLRRRSRYSTEPVSADGPDVPVRASAVERLELQRLLQELPRRQREVLVLRYLADLTEAATAAALGTSVGTVKQHAHRGLAAMRIAWDALEPDAPADAPTTPNLGGH